MEEGKVIWHFQGPDNTCRGRPTVSMSLTPSLANMTSTCKSTYSYTAMNGGMKYLIIKSNYVNHISNFLIKYFTQILDC